MTTQTKFLLAGCVTLAATTTFAVRSFGIQADLPLAFEVATIRQKALPDGAFLRRGNTTPELRCPPMHCGINGNRFTEEGASLLDLIMDAYALKRYQVTGLPPWGDSGKDVYDLAATVGGDRPASVAEARRMLQTLLAERFQLKFRRESKEMPVYFLTLGKNGSKLKPIAQEEGKPPVTNCPGARGRDEEGPSPEAAAANRSWSHVAEVLSLFLDRPVIDKTGYSGFYCTPDGQNALPAVMNPLMSGGGGVGSRGARGGGGASRSTGDGSDDSDLAPPSLLNLVQDKWGLRVESGKAVMDLLVVEKAERPIAN